VREETEAKGVILIVFGGSLGSGFSVQAPPDVTAALPAILRRVADQIERDNDGRGGDSKP
jgi:UDP-N-acetylglucosamine:LPS N-acetylglucosamine transferase